MQLIQDDHVVEALAADSPDQALDEWILPGTSRGRDHVLNAHVPDAALEVRSIDLVPITQEVARRAVPRERLHDLLSRPLGRGVCGHIEMEPPASLVCEDQEDEEDLISHSPHCHVQPWTSIS
jgi:hypothetical protein